MAISVIKKKGINPNTGAELWRIQWTREDTVDEKKLARTMARGGTYSVGEASGVLLDFPQYFVDELLNGNAVHIDGLGTFKLRVTAATNADPDKLTTRGAKVQMVLDADADLLQVDNVMADPLSAVNTARRISVRLASKGCTCSAGNWLSAWRSMVEV